MIHVDRSAVPMPSSLASGRAEDQRAQIANLLAEESRREQVTIDFKIEIYKSAQPALLELFHDKCAYCESPVGEAGPADIEHYRPKQGASDMEGKKRDHLYYAWLAYDWDNLLIACAACNRRRRSADGQIVGKGERFPVEGVRAPLLSTVEQCRALERPLLLDPCYDQPSEHLRFEDDGTCVPLSPRGEFTIALLDLNRSFLVRSRETTVRGLTLIAEEWIRRTEGDPDKASSDSRELQEMLSAARPYAAAARQAFARFQARLTSRDVQVRILDTLRTFLPQEDLSRAVQASEAQASDLSPEIQKAATSAPEQYEGRAALPSYAQARLTRIVIRNFKAIEHLELEVPVVSTEANDAAGALMLLGENATGKSTVLEAIALTLLGTKQASKLNVEPSTLRRRAVGAAPGSEEPPRVELWFEGFTTPRTLEVRNNRFEGDADPATILLGYGPRRFFRSGGKSLLAAFTWGPAQFERVRTLFDPIATITNPSDWLAKLAPDQFNAIVRALKKLLMMPDDADYVHKPTGKSGDTEITFTLDGIKVPLSQLSEGYRTIIATSVDVMRELLRYWPDLESAQGVVLIDEVETHLHPRWKMRIVRLLRQAMPRVQFIMTTHDPLCLRGLEDGEVTVMFRDEQRRVSTVTDLPSVTGLSVQQLLTSEYFGLYTTEDPRAEEQLSNYVALANKTDRTEDEEREFKRQRDIALKRLAPGALPAQRVVYEAVNATLQQNAEQTRYKRADLNREAMAKAIELFTSTPNQS